MYFSKAKYFTYSIFIMLFIVIFSYVLLYFHQIEKSSWGVHSFKDFSLRHTENFQRIIIESGSNSTHAINSQMIENEFHKVVLNLADNAGYPLLNKLYRIEKYAKEGDIVLLPLEYLHYLYQDPPKIYFDGLFGHLDFYFDSLPLREQLHVIFQTPVSSFINAFTKETKRVDNSLLFADKFNQGYRGDLEFIKKSKLDAYSGSMDCVDYILPRTGEYTISDVFKKNIRLMKKIAQEKNITFVFTYPAVVGDGCYNGKNAKAFIQFDKELHHYLEKNGFSLIGIPSDSLFEEKYMNNTYYHVMPDARDIRTKKLIKNINTSSLSSVFHSTNKDKKPKLSYTPYLNELQPLSNNRLYTLNDTKKIKLLSGWYDQEKWGAWSKNDESHLIFKIDPEQRKNGLKLTLLLRTFGNKDETKIYLNHQFLGSYLLDNEVGIIIPPHLLNKETVLLSFYYTNVHSPQELGMNDDIRKIKLGFDGLKVQSLNTLKSLKTDTTYVLSDASNPIELLQGWYPREKWGVWSKKEKNKLLFKVDKKLLQRGIVLTLKARIFGERKKTHILINNRSLGSFLLKGEQNIMIKPEFLQSEVITLEMQNADVHSPKELGINNDIRELKIGLETLKIQPL